MTVPHSGTAGILVALGGALLLGVVLPRSVPAQTTARAPAERPTLEAARTSGSIEIDGRLDEAAWDGARIATDFVQGRPTEGAAPAQPTEVRILYDSESLYVGARMSEPDRSAIADQLVRRDEEGQYDHFEISLDPNLDRQTGYVFRVGVSGVERDAYVTGGGSNRRGGGGPDGDGGVNWDAVWESATSVDSAGWTAELRIPLSQIRYESRPGSQEWGVNFARRRLASNSTSFWSLESRTVQGTVTQWGRLAGLRFEETQRRFEVEPYAVGQIALRPVDSRNPLLSERELTGRSGLNLSYGVGSAFTLDATVNPDFGQVEADPAVVNLTAFETFFPEKRPFFVQDAQIFDFDMSGRSSRLFFSRRIGRAPQGRVPDSASFSDVPDRTNILGAAKFTGRTQGGLSVGALTAVTGDERGRAYFSDTGRIREPVVEPRTGYGVARVQQDFRDGATTIGGIFTGVERRLPADGRLDHLTDRAFSGGLDFEHQWGGPNDRRWSLSGYYAGTHVRGSREAILRIQTDPQHYFQRPDAERVELDSTRTSMSGSNWRLELNRQSAEHWTWGVWMAEITPGFAANDIGFNTERARLDGGARVRYQDIDPGSILRTWWVSAFTFHNLRHTLLDDPFSADRWGRSYQDGRVNVDLWMQFTDNSWLSPELGYQPESLSASLTRGGPLMTRPSELSVELRGSTDDRQPVSVGPNVQYTELGLDAGRRWNLGLELFLRPAPNWQIQLRPQFRDETSAAQYVATAEEAGHGPTYGDRYLFADLERTQLSLETRVNVTFSPELSLQVFAQPLVSAVDFASIKQLARPSTYDFDRFSEGRSVEEGGEVGCVGGRTCVVDGVRHLDFDGDGASDFSFEERDFNLRSVRGTAVVRWEYQPGSILFLVWQHDRRGRVGIGDFDFTRDAGAVFGGTAENRLIVKASYFLDL